MNYLQILILPTILLTVFGYLFGSISSSIIITKIFINEDVRKHGSGNAGMTNVLRTAGKVPAILTFVSDFLKCIIPVSITYFVAKNICVNNNLSLEAVNVVEALVGLACVLGHIFPVYFGFRGGKGVVTAAAMIAIVDWRAFIVVISVFVISFGLKKIVSLSSIMAAASYPFATFAVLMIFDKDKISALSIIIMTFAAFVLGFVVVIKHKANIKRLLKGEEKAIVSKK